MRGRTSGQVELFQMVDLEKVVPKDHPIRPIKKIVDQILGDMSGDFDRMYSDWGRSSIPPERLLKSRILMALFSVRSERLFAEQLHYNFLFRWFLDMNNEEVPFNHSVFSKNQARILEHAAAKLFFELVVDHARLQSYVSDEHFSVDGTLIEAWASNKSFVPKAEDDDHPKGRNPSKDFHGQSRSNKTHHSKTDKEARLMRKGKGKEAKLCFGAHALMENRNGLCVQFRMGYSTESESNEAKAMLEEMEKLHGIQPTSLGADKGYHNKDLVGFLRERKIKPHIAEITGRRVEGLDGRTTRSKGCGKSQKVRKRIEEIFGWMKTVGGLKKSRYRGIESNEMWASFVASSYNLVRLAKLGQSPPMEVAP